MADAVLELAPQPDRTARCSPTPAADRRICARICASSSSSCCPCIAAAAGVGFYLDGRPLHLDRQRLCRRPEGADHAGHFRQSQPGAGARGAACRRRRSAVRDRSGAVPARAPAGAEQARHRAHRLRQSEEQLPVAQPPRRTGARSTSRSSGATSSARQTLAGEPMPARRSMSTTARPRFVTAELQTAARPAAARHARSTSCSAIAELPIEQFPPYRQAQAALDQAQRDLDHTTIKAPIAGTATQVDNIQLGRFVTAGTPVFSVIDDAAPWVDANPQGNRHHLSARRAAGRRSMSTRFPDRSFHGHRRVGQPGNGRAVRDPAAAECQRQLGEGGAARAGAHRLR